ncbi:MAG: peptidylprolyl isomerase [Planctomycetes bacterium]|nr:peptidylprolyl isomerase [Planctomycetota bacterium]
MDNTENQTQEQSFPAKVSEFIRTRQNVIFFILLAAGLVAALLIWRNYRINQMSLKAWYDMSKTQQAEALQGILQVHNITNAAPFLHYQLANAYFDDEKYAEAKKEYEYIIEKYPDSPVREWANRRLNALRVNEQWMASDLTNHLNELRKERGLPVLTAKTRKGEFEMELYQDESPNTVANFLYLAQQGFYKQTAVYEIKPDLGVCFGYRTVTSPAISSGISTETALSAIPFEKNSLKHQEGSIGMLRQIDPAYAPVRAAGAPASADKEEPKYLNSATYRFYISTRTNPDIDGKYTIFGRVTKGMDIIRQLARGDENVDVILNWKREQEYKPQTVELQMEEPVISPTWLFTPPPQPPLPPLPAEVPPGGTKEGVPMTPPQIAPLPPTPPVPMPPNPVPPDPTPPTPR